MEKTFHLSYIDKGTFLKGLLILIAQDRQISEHEKRLVMKAGKTLGFDKEFCEESIDQVLHNSNIKDEPPVFHDPDFAKSFIIDGLKFISKDSRYVKSNLYWLKETVLKNNLSLDWFEEQILTHLKNKHEVPYENISFEIAHVLENSYSH